MTPASSLLLVRVVEKQPEKVTYYFNGSRLHRPSPRPTSTIVMQAVLGRACSPGYTERRAAYVARDNTVR